MAWSWFFLMKENQKIKDLFHKYLAFIFFKGVKRVKTIFQQLDKSLINTICISNKIIPSASCYRSVQWFLFE